MKRYLAVKLCMYTRALSSSVYACVCVHGIHYSLKYCRRDTHANCIPPAHPRLCDTSRFNNRESVCVPLSLCGLGHAIINPLALHTHYHFVIQQISHGLECRKHNSVTPFCLFLWRHQRSAETSAPECHLSATWRER